MDRVIVGPVLEDINRIGLAGNKVFIATAFYSRTALEYLDIKSDKLFFYCRLDFNELTEWINGLIDPKALYEKVKEISQDTDIHLYVSKTAHAKLYMGNKAALIGSANLTLSGFGGNCEMLFLIENRRSLDQIENNIVVYSRKMEEISLDKLERFVLNNEKNVIKQRSDRRIISHERMPLYSRNTLKRLGSYEDFKKWLKKQNNEAAKEILRRAEGKHNLQGHIHRGFYGLRQYLISYPRERKKYELLNANDYKLSIDANAEVRLKAFVRNIAVDEDDFQIKIWRTYLPKECGGKAAKHGGSIGNLNRMFPLVAKYLKQKLFHINREQ